MLGVQANAVLGTLAGVAFIVPERNGLSTAVGDFLFAKPRVRQELINLAPEKPHIRCEHHQVGVELR